jgi:hypothetical protein
MAYESVRRGEAVPAPIVPPPHPQLASLTIVGASYPAAAGPGFGTNAHR